MLRLSVRGEQVRNLCAEQESGVSLTHCWSEQIASLDRSVRPLRDEETLD
jgi:hypothetical protein